MKTYSKFIVLILLVLILSACTGNATATQEEASLSNIYTAAAMTLSAQVSATPAMITSTPAASPTILSFPTSVPVTPTFQSMVSYASNSTANRCNDSAYISDVTISDGTVLAAGESFTKT